MDHRSGASRDSAVFSSITTGGPHEFFGHTDMDRLYLRGRENVHKRLLVQAAACNLALLLRSLYGAGKPKAAHDLKGAAIFVFLRLMSVLVEAECVERDFRASPHLAVNDHQVSRSSFCRSSKPAV